jgi:ABC-type polysaccharide/polyol phosphate export permease
VRNTFLLVSKIVSIEIRNRYKWSRLGSLWVILSFSIYCISVSIVYSRIFDQNLKEYLPYLASGLLSWTFIQSFYVEGITLFSNYKGYIVNINLPFHIYSLISVLRNLVIFLYQIPVLIIIKIIFLSPVSFSMLMFPFSLTLVFIIGVLISGILAPIGVIFKDFAQLVPAVATILTLVTPILYPKELLKSATWLYELNPMYYLVTLVRDPLLGKFPSFQVICTCLLFVISLIPIQVFVNRIFGKRIVPII